MFAARRLATRVSLPKPQVASFHKTAPAFVQKGDAVPDLNVLVEGSPGNKVNLANEFKGTKGLIIGTPAAFSMLFFYSDCLLPFVFPEYQLFVLTTA